MESAVLTFMMDHVMVCPVNTIVHVPRSVHLLLARVLSVELRKACSSVWAFVRLTMFAKAVLRISATNIVNVVALSCLLFYLTVYIFGISLGAFIAFGILC